MMQVLMKEAAVFDKPYAKKSAWVGAETFPQLFSESVRSFSRREFPALKPARKLWHGS
jgi:hypothetical protein